VIWGSPNAGLIILSIVALGSPSQAEQTSPPAASSPSQGTAPGAPPASAPVPAAPASESPKENAFEILRQATVSVGRVTVDGGVSKYATVGSAIIISESPHIGCLLTAKHMFYDPEHKWFPTKINIRLPPVTGSEPINEGVTVQLVSQTGNLWSSPSDGSDLAVIRLGSMEPYETRQVQALNPGSFGTSDDIYPGAPIMALGYPVLLGEDFLTTPYARGGIISWTDIANPTGKPFLVDANLYLGNSGGPVFKLPTGFDKNGRLMLGGKIALIGIVSKGVTETVGVVAGGTPVTATDTKTGQVNPEQAMVYGIGGTGIVEPITRAREIIDDCLHAASAPSTGGSSDAPAPH
jgi:hypothetical protein